MRHRVEHATDVRRRRRRVDAVCNKPVLGRFLSRVQVAHDAGHGLQAFELSLGRNGDGGAELLEDGDGARLGRRHDGRAGVLRDGRQRTG